MITAHIFGRCTNVYLEQISNLSYSEIYIIVKINIFTININPIAYNNLHTRYKSYFTTFPSVLSRDLKTLMTRFPTLYKIIVVAAKTMVPPGRFSLFSKNN